MSLLREAGTDRWRASVRALVPAVGTLAVFLLVGAGLGTVVDHVSGAGALGRALAASLSQLVLYAGLVLLARWLARRLENRPDAAFGLRIDRAWVRQFAAGVVISVTAIGLSWGWAAFRELRAVDLDGAGLAGPGGPVAAGAVLAAFIGLFLAGNVYEELVYRRIVLANVAEGLFARGISPRRAVVAASVASLVLFGAYHIPLRGSVLVALDAAIVGVAFVVPYLLSGELALPIGVHFGRVLLELGHGLHLGAYELQPVVRLTQDTLGANLEVKLVRLGLVCVLVVGWASLRADELGVDDSVIRPS